MSSTLKWLLGILIVLILAAAGFFVWQKLKPKITPTPPSSTPTQTSTADLKTYEDKEIGFSFQYPSNLQIIPQDKIGNGDLGEIYLAVKTDKISEIGDMPLNFGGDVALKDKAALEKGDASVRVGQSMGARLLKLTGAVGKEQVRLSELDTTVNEIELSAIIYKNDYRIIIYSVYNNRVNLVKNNPSYFEIIGAYPVWSDKGMGNFTNDLFNGKTDTETQTWYKQFNQIISTLNFNI